MKHGADEIEEEGDDGALSPMGDGALSPGGDGATSPGGDGSQSPTNAGSLVGQLPYIILYTTSYTLYPALARWWDGSHPTVHVDSRLTACRRLRFRF